MARWPDEEVTVSEYIPSPTQWVAEQVELYEGSGGTEGTTLRGLPVIIVTHRGRKTGAVRKTPLMTVADGDNYVLIASRGGAPKHPLWYHNLAADPNVEIRDGTETHSIRVRGGSRFSRETATLGPRSSSLPSLPGLPRKDRPHNPGLPSRTRRINRSPTRVGRQGFEPWTLGLKVRCSDQTELPAHRWLVMRAKGVWQRRSSMARVACSPGTILPLDGPAPNGFAIDRRTPAPRGSDRSSALADPESQSGEVLPRPHRWRGSTKGSGRVPHA